MTNKNRVKVLVAVLLVVVMSLSLFACKKEEKYVEQKVYEKNYDNDRFYYVVYYPDDWTVTAGNEGFELAPLNPKRADQDGYLCCKLFPASQAGNVDDIKASFTVYKLDTKSMMNTIKEFADKLLDPNSLYYLNDVFVEEGLERTSFNFKDTESTKENPNHFQFNTAHYDFVRNGEEWKGKFYVSSANNTWMFVVCVESVESEWDANYEIFKGMMHDFSFRGYEETKEK